jgi:hypothetical protein
MQALRLKQLGWQQCDGATALGASEAAGSVCWGLGVLECVETPKWSCALAGGGAAELG